MSSPRHNHHCHEEACFVPSTGGVQLEARIFNPPPALASSSSYSASSSSLDGSDDSPAYHSPPSASSSARRSFDRVSHRSICVIITHPYGRLGGNLHNNVVESCFQYFSGEGFMTVRFNFRGVGQSTGSSTLRGNGELDDVLSVYRYVKERPNLAPRHFILCGYSYGSIATGAVCPDIPECIGLISIAYPAGVLWFLTMGNSSRFTEGIRSVRENMPKLFIMGSKDNFTSVKSFQDFVASIPQPRQVKLIDGIDHFWFESEHIITECINLWMKSSHVVPAAPKGNPLPSIESLRQIRQEERQKRIEEKRSRSPLSESTPSLSSGSESAPPPRPISPTRNRMALSTPSLDSAREQAGKKYETDRAQLLGNRPSSPAVPARPSASPSASASTLDGGEQKAPAKPVAKSVQSLSTVGELKEAPANPWADSPSTDTLTKV